MNSSGTKKRRCSTQSSDGEEDNKPSSESHATPRGKRKRLEEIKVSDSYQIINKVSRWQW